MSKGNLSYILEPSSGIDTVKPMKFDGIEVTDHSGTIEDFTVLGPINIEVEVAGRIGAAFQLSVEVKYTRGPKKGQTKKLKIHPIESKVMSNGIGQITDSYELQD